MSRSCDDLELKAGLGDNVAVVIVFAALGELEHHAAHADLIALVALIYIHRAACLLGDGVDGSDMVKMAVSEHDRLTFQIIRLYIVHDGVALVAGVYHDALEGILVYDDIAVCFKLAYWQSFNIHFQSSLVSRIMVTGPSFIDSTFISAPNSPVPTSKPRLRHSAMTFS